MAEMVRIGNKICSKEYGYPYAVLEDNETWYLYDHIKNSGTYAKVKEIQQVDITENCFKYIISKQSFGK